MKSLRKMQVGFVRRSEPKFKGRTEVESGVLGGFRGCFDSRNGNDGATKPMHGGLARRFGALVD